MKKKRLTNKSTTGIYDVCGYVMLKIDTMVCNGCHSSLKKNSHILSVTFLLYNNFVIFQFQAFFKNI